MDKKRENAKNPCGLEGVQYIVDSEGHKKGVLIDLNIWGDEWEDFYDILVSKERSSESLVEWDKLKK